MKQLELSDELSKPTSEGLKSVLKKTTIISPVKLQQKIGFPVLLALESLQHTGSFKFRAAYNAASKSNSSHLITASSGNFGQALAYACKLLGKTCTVIMPRNSSRAKVSAVESFEAEAILVDVNEKPRDAWVEEVLRTKNGAEAVSPYNDYRVIQGNSSLAEELEDRRKHFPFDDVVVPIGGGGLSSGLIVGFKRNDSPVTIYGAEPKLANDAARSLQLGSMQKNESEPQTIADGVRTLSVGEKNWPILRDGLKSILEVSEESIKEATRLLFSYANVKAEPTGALALAAILENADNFKGRTPLAIVSGGNVDVEVFTALLSSRSNESG